MESRDPAPSNAPQRPIKPRRSWFRFKFATMIVVGLLVAAMAGIFRWELFSVLAGVSLLFAIFMFAEDIWPWLPR